MASPNCIFVFFGPPGAGKGEQAKRLASHMAMPHISTGDLLRAECKNNSPTGDFIQQFLKQGQFPPDELILDLLTNRIAQKDCNQGFILDGFPRTLKQAQILDHSFSSTHRLIFINVSLDKMILMQRLMGRRLCMKCTRTYHTVFLPPITNDHCDDCHVKLHIRNDDTEQVIEERLRIFSEQFSQMLPYYQNRADWIEINSKDAPHACFENLLENISQKIKICATANS